MAVLSGLERASGGTVRIVGEDFGALDEDRLAEARRGRIGIVLQAFHLLPTMTALENVAVPMELAGQADAFAAARAELEAVGLGHRLDHYPAQLSGGEQQRVAIARALGPRPALLFADEPTGNLDAATGGAIVDLLFERCDAAGRDPGRHHPRADARAALQPGDRARRRADRRGPRGMSRWRLAWTIGRRELDWKFRGLRLLFFSLLLGVAALAAVGSLAAAMDRGLSSAAGSSLAAMSNSPARRGPPRRRSGRRSTPPDGSPNRSA